VVVGGGGTPKRDDDLFSWQKVTDPLCFAYFGAKSAMTSSIEREREREKTLISMMGKKEDE
jgi:hypothetical protein